MTWLRRYPSTVTVADLKRKENDNDFCTDRKIDINSDSVFTFNF